MGRVCSVVSLAVVGAPRHWAILACSAGSQTGESPILDWSALRISKADASDGLVLDIQAGDLVVRWTVYWQYRLLWVCLGGVQPVRRQAIPPGWEEGDGPAACVAWGSLQQACSRMRAAINVWVTSGLGHRPSQFVHDLAVLSERGRAALKAWGKKRGPKPGAQPQPKPKGRVAATVAISHADIQVHGNECLYSDASVESRGLGCVVYCISRGAIPPAEYACLPQAACQRLDAPFLTVC
jgi:hypothetical protein